MFSVLTCIVIDHDIRLVILAAGWTLAVLVVSAIVLAMLFQQAAIRRFDQGLSELIDNLIAGATIDEKGEVLAPALTDTRALRAFSGKYWQIAEPTPDGGIRVLLVDDGAPLIRLGHQSRSRVG